MFTLEVSISDICFLNFNTYEGDTDNSSMPSETKKGSNYSSRANSPHIPTGILFL